MTPDDVADELATADRLEQLGRSVAEITDHEERYRAFRRLAAELDAVGLLEEDDRARAFGRLAARLARFDQVEQATRKANDAQETAEGITDPARRAKVLVELVDMFVATQHLDWAKRAATSIRDPGLRAEGLMNLMGAYATAGQILPAKSIAETAQRAAFGIVDPGQQASALVRLAEEYIRIGSEECMMAARKLCGLVLTTPGWRRALFLIGKLDAQCLITAVAALTEKVN